MIANSDLILGEIFTFPDNVDTNHESVSDEEINKKYKKREIRIITEQARYPLDSIPTMLDSKKYILDPEYKRRKRWGNTRKSRLIESLIMNVPIPPIFLYEIEYSLYEVIDGQQRLTTIYDFYKGKFFLEELEYWQELEGRNYQNLPGQVRKILDRRYLSFIVLLQETAESLEEAEHIKKIVFQRLNSGGEELTPQETRNALYNGKFNQLCLKLSQNDYFRKMWKFPLQSEGEEKLLESESYRKMEDVELVLRFFAYRHLDKLKLPVDKFLDEYLKQANNFPDETIENLEKLFNETIELIYYILEDSAFIPPPPQGERNRKIPLKIVYDPIMQVFASKLPFKNELLKHKEAIKNEMYSDEKMLYVEEENNRFLFEGRYATKKALETRIEYFDKFLQSYIK